MYKGAKVVVAGGTGVVGVPIVQQLVSKGALVTVVGMESENVVAKYLPRNIKYLQRDLLQLENCKEVFKGHQIILNLAGTKRSVGIGYKGVSNFFTNMLKLQINIMEIAHDLRVERFLFVGSICEYPTIAIRSEDEVWNGKPAQNDWLSGVQKRIGESQGEAYFLDTGWDAVRVVRLSNVYGPFDNFTEENGQVIPALISKLIKNSRKLQIIGDGSNVRDFIFSEDAAYWSLEALEKAPSTYPINIGSGVGTSIKSIAENLIEIFGYKTEVEYRPLMQSGDKERVLNTDRAKRVLNFHERVSIPDGLRKTVEWIRENPDWNNYKYL